MNKLKTNLFLISSVVALLASASVMVFFFKIIQNKNEHTSNVLSVMEEKILRKNNKDAILEKFNEINEKHEVINSYFVDQAHMDIFVEYLEKIGVDSGVDLSVKSIEVAKKEKNTVYVKTSFSGKLQNVMNTVALIENAPYQIRATSFYLNKDTDLVQTTKTEKPLIKEPTIWKADLMFSVLSS